MTMIQTVFFSTMVKDNIAANLIAACPDGIIGVDLRGAVVIFNAKAAALTQRNPEDVIGSLNIDQIYGTRELRVISIIDGLIFTVFEGNYLSLTFRK